MNIVKLSPECFLSFSGKCAYIYRKPMGSYFINMFKIIREAWRIRKRKRAQYEHRLNLTR